MVFELLSSSHCNPRIPTTILVIEGKKRVAKNANEGKFQTKLDVKKTKDLTIDCLKTVSIVEGNPATPIENFVVSRSDLL